MRTTLAIALLFLTGCAAKKHAITTPTHQVCSLVAVDVKTRETTSLCQRDGKTYEVKVLPLDEKDQ
jgi:uncharacterized lipoprotein YajG